MWFRPTSHEKSFPKKRQARDNTRHFHLRSDLYISVDDQQFFIVGPERPGPGCSDNGHHSFPDAAIAGHWFPSLTAGR